MASTFTPSIGLEKQGTGENPNAWGARLNSALDRIDERVDGVASTAVTGNFTIIIENAIASEGRKAVQIMTGTPVGDFTVTLPERMLNRWFHNKTGKTATITLGTGATCTVRDGQLSFVYADPVLGCFVHDPTLDTVKAPAADVSLNNKKLTSVAAPSADTDGANRAFVEAAPAARSMGDHKITNLAAGVAPTDATNVAQVAGIVQPIAQEAADSAQAAADSAEAAGTSETNAGESETNAALSEGHASDYAADAAASAAKLTGTSTSSVAIGTGAKSWATQSGKFFEAGSRVLVTSNADPVGRAMFGVVTDYTTGALSVDVSVSAGSGTYADWTIRVCGERGPIGPSGAVTLDRSARTSNTQLALTDIGKLIDITSGTFTQTFAGAATLGAGWWCYLRNSGTGDITLDPSGAEAIDGLTSYIMYPGECRVIQCDGTALVTVVVTAFAKIFAASDTFVKPPGYAVFEGRAFAGGGGGAKGVSGTGAGGGGGGACVPFSLRASQISASETVTIGSGGVGAATNSTDGGGGGNTSLGTIVATYGGASGKAAGFGGGGGGTSGGTIDAIGGAPLGGTVGGVSTFGGGGSGSASAATPPGSSVFGGGGGGGRFAGAGKGGDSLHGGGGGGGIANDGTSAGGGVSSAGLGGASNSATSGVNGAIPSGGGGATLTGAKAGDGARGELRIWGVA